MTDQERIAALRKALEMAHYELLTLYPRLTAPYAASVKATGEEIKRVLIATVPS